MEAETGVALWRGVGQISELGRRKRKRTEAFCVIRRWASWRRKRFGAVAIAMQGVCRPAAGVLWWTERANLER